MKKQFHVKLKRMCCSFLSLSCLLSTTALTSVSAKTVDSPLYEDFESITIAASANQYWHYPAGWTQKTFSGDNPTSAVLTARNDLDGYYLKIASKTNAYMAANPLNGAAKESGLTIGTKPIITSFDILLNGADQGENIKRIRAGILSTKGADGAAQSIVVNFTGNDDGSWSVGEVGSLESNRAMVASLLTSQDKEYKISKADSEKWHRVDLVYYPETKEVNYFIDGEQLYTANQNPNYALPADGSFGAFGYFCGTGTTDNAYFGLDNISIREYENADECIKRVYANAGQNKISASWSESPVKLPVAEDFTVTKYKTVSDAVLCVNGEAITPQSITVNSTGFYFTLAEALNAYEQYKIEISPESNILGNSQDNVINVSVIPQISDGRVIEEKIVTNYNFDALPPQGTLTFTTGYNVTSPEEPFEGDARLYVDTNATGVGGVYIKSDFTVNDDLQYADISFDVKNIWRNGAGANSDRLEFGLGQWQNESGGQSLIQLTRCFYQGIIQVSNQSGAPVTGTTAQADKTLYKESDWNSFKIRYYPQYPGNPAKAAYDLMIKDANGTYQSITSMLVAPKLTAPLCVFLGGVRVGRSYFDNLTVKTVSQKEITASNKITSIDFIGADGRLTKQKSGADKILVGVCSENLKVSLYEGNEKETDSSLISDGVLTLTIDGGLKNSTEYTLKIDDEDYLTFTTESEEFNISGLVLCDNDGNELDSIPSANTAVKAKFMAVNKVESKNVNIILAAYNSAGKLLQVKYIPTELTAGLNGYVLSGDALTVTEDVKKINAFVWDNGLVPLTNSAEKE